MSRISRTFSTYCVVRVGIDLEANHWQVVPVSLKDNRSHTSCRQLLHRHVNGSVDGTSVCALVACVLLSYPGSAKLHALRILSRVGLPSPAIKPSHSFTRDSVVLVVFAQHLDIL